MCLNPVCFSCMREMTAKKNEVGVRDDAKDDEIATVRSGDLFECDVCGHKVITGFGEGMPIRSGPSRDAALVFSRRGQPSTRGPMIDADIPVESIRAVVEYNWDEEEPDYKEHIRLGNSDGEGHVFTHLKKIAEWLKQTDLNPSGPLLHEQENDYRLKENHPSAWIAVDDLVVYIHKRIDGAPIDGVIIDVFKNGEEADDPLRSMFVLNE